MVGQPAFAFVLRRCDCRRAKNQEENMYRTYLTKLKGRTLTVVFLALLGMVPKPEAQQPQSFTPTSLPPGFTQQIFGTAPVTDSLIMTGVAFVPKIGDV
jgi:hypothetical protein